MEAVEAPTPDTVVFRLKYRRPLHCASLALAVELDLQGRHPGRGPALVREERDGHRALHVRRVRARARTGSGKKNPDYWDKGKPYLDGYRAIFIHDASAQVGGDPRRARHDPVPRLQPGAIATPSSRRSGNKITVQESPWNCSIQVAMNQEKKPFEDKRVCRALSAGARPATRAPRRCSRIAIVKDVAGIQVPGTPWATPPDELAKLAGYRTDINAARARGTARLLKEAGAGGPVRSPS